MPQGITLRVLMRRYHLTPLATSAKLLRALRARKGCSETTRSESLVVMLTLIVDPRHILLDAETTATSQLFVLRLLVTHLYFMVD